jgi:hypothetical protein
MYTTLHLLFSSPQAAIQHYNYLSSVYTYALLMKLLELPSTIPRTWWGLLWSLAYKHLRTYVRRNTRKKLYSYIICKRTYCCLTFVGSYINYKILKARNKHYNSIKTWEDIIQTSLIYLRVFGRMVSYETLPCVEKLAVLAILILTKYWVSWLRW